MDSKQFESLLHDAEVKLKRLRALYEQYFQGIERLEPSVPRKDLDRLFHRLHRDKPRNTAARFKLNQLQASYNLYQSYWARITRQIEEGTYARDLRRARRRGARSRDEDREVKTFELDLDGGSTDTDALGEVLARTSAESGDPESAATGEDAGPRPKSDTIPSAAPAENDPAAAAVAAAAASVQSLPRNELSLSTNTSPSRPAGALPRRPAGSLPGTRPLGTLGPPPASARTDEGPPATRGAPKVPPPPPTGRAPARPPPPPPGGRRRAASPPPQPPADPMRRLYDDFVAARRRNGEAGDHMGYEKLASSVRKMESRLRERHKGKQIGFEVVVKNGKVGLKPKIS